MLTVKHIRLSGEEDIYQSATVRYSPGEDKSTHGFPASVFLDLGEPLTGGTVFVMGDSGKTVARYDLGASMVPLGVSHSFVSEVRGAAPSRGAEHMNNQAVSAAQTSQL